MYYVYVLKSKQYKWLYIGSSQNLKRRFNEHTSGKVRSTQPYAPFDLIYYEAYADKSDSLDRERKLKHHGSAKRHLMKRIHQSIALFD